MWRKIEKQIIQNEEFNMKESRFDFNKPSSGFRKNVMKCRLIIDECLTKSKTREEIIYTEKGSVNR